MDIKTTIKILEALASGYSPTTGEKIQNDSVLNERDVIRALQIGIDNLKTDTSMFTSKIEIEIDDNDIQEAVALFKSQDQNLTSTSLTSFFLGNRKFKNDLLVNYHLYGKFSEIYPEGDLIKYFDKYLAENASIEKNKRKKEPYRDIDYFQKEKFNKLSMEAINRLKEKVNELGIKKTENISEYVRTARKKHPRAYESWTDEEKELLSIAIKFTNDLDLLSAAFQRGKNSIESFGQRLIWESQNMNECKD